MKKSTVKRKNSLRGMKEARPPLRKDWGNLNPTSRVIQSGKKYDRSKFKKWNLNCDW